MQRKIIIQAQEEILCPKCSHQFPLTEGVAGHAVEGYALEFESALQQRARDMEAQLASEAERKAMQATAIQLSQLQDELAEARRAGKEAQAAISKAREQGRTTAIEETQTDRTAMKLEMARKDDLLRQFREQELTLRQQKQALEEREQNLQVDFQRNLDIERKTIADSITARESERFQRMEAEYRKKIEDATRANEDLRCKLEQGSQQLQGEVLELEIERTLKHTFFHDLIEEVKKGIRGADAIQTVRTPAGIAAGKIIWEAKRAENWSDKWLAKLKDDQCEAKAEIAVLVTTAMPKGAQQLFCRMGDVWVIPPHLLCPVAETLRVILLETHQLRQANTCKGEKIELLYNYLASPAFSQRVRTVLEAFHTMQVDLDTEKRAMQRLWAKRQTQIDQVTLSMNSVVGELQAIAQESLPELNKLEIWAPEALHLAANQ